MGRFVLTETAIRGVLIIDPQVFQDERGFFMESYNARDFKEAGLDVAFVQDNHTKSAKGVLRGLHLQIRHPQGKLMRVLKGEVFDVAVDARKDSPTFGKWTGTVLSEENRRQMYIAPGLAHGYLVLSEAAELIYKCTDFYYPEDERGIIWNDPDIGIDWPAVEGNGYLLSKKDLGWGSFREFIQRK
ncbi:MAG: dTDP-4-dehydrorhamnose 3,5-epimerase [Bacillota bacterium]